MLFLVGDLTLWMIESWSKKNIPLHYINSGGVRKQCVKNSIGPPEINPNNYNFRHLQVAHGYKSVSKV